MDKLEFDGGGSRFVIRRLRKYTKYEIVVQAVNTFGEGPLSIPSIGQTKEDGKKNAIIRQEFYEAERALILLG